MTARDTGTVRTTSVVEEAAPTAAFARRLAVAMRERGMRQADVIRAAEGLGSRLGKSQMSQYVGGKTMPRRRVMATLAEVLGVDAEWLSGRGADEPPASGPASDEASDEQSE